MHTLFYPVDWPAIAREIKELNHWRCAACDKCCRRPGEPRISWQNELTVAHYDHVYDADAVFVVPLCVPCHLRYDAPFAWWHRRQWEQWRREDAGQLTLALKAP